MLSFIKKKKRNVLVVFVLIFFAGLSKLLGFIRNAVLAYYFGTTHSADTFNLLLYPTELILSFVVNNTIITALTSFYGKSEDDKAQTFWKVIHFYEVVLLAIATIIITFMVFIYSGVGIGYLVLGGVVAVLYGISGIIQSFLNYKLKFFSSSVQDVVSQVVLTSGIIVAHYFGIGSFAIFMIMSGILRILVQLPELKESLGDSFSLKNIIPKTMSIDIEIIKYIVPLILSFFLSTIPSFIILANLHYTGEGYISAYNYAVKVITLFNPIFVVPFTTYVIPKLQHLLEKNEKNTVRQVHVIAIITIFITSACVALIFWLFSEQIAKLLYFRGNFTVEALVLTGTMLRWISFTVIGYAVMFYLLQLVLMHKHNKLVLLCYAVGTFVTVTLLFINQSFPIPQRVSLALVSGTFVSIGILMADVLKRIKK